MWNTQTGNKQEKEREREGEKKRSLKWPQKKFCLTQSTGTNKLKLRQNKVKECK